VANEISHVLFDRLKRSTGRPGRKNGKDCVSHFTGTALSVGRRFVHKRRRRRLDVFVNVPSQVEAVSYAV
jgi:hypothetical protein